ncbi:MAG: C13 family peptidase, partial [Xanthobacteraceae bacterium]
MRAFGRIAAILTALSAAGLLVLPASVLAQRKVDAPAKIAPTEALFANPQQARLLQKQFSVLAPQRKGVTDVYAIGVAGWAKQDVFVHELDGALASIERTLPIEGRTLRLANNPYTVQTLPLASRQNFAAAVRAVGRVIDKDEDILILFMTSHGAVRGIGLQLPGITVDLAPAEVAAVLTKEGIKNRIVIISACYSGVFVKPLANDNTIVLTAADEKSPSFGCGAKRQWTYFGDAFFNQSLKPGMDFKRAFVSAEKLIRGWEKSDRLAPSNPQAHFGDTLVRKLAPLFATPAP